MKTIGLLGGMSWESTAEYYRILNEAVRDRLGPLHSAKIALYSVDFSEIEALQHQGRWSEAGTILIEAARSVERAGADLLLICTNTMHKLAGEIQDAIRIPVLHIADATADAIRGQGIRTVGLLATRFTMEEAFYKGRLVDRHGLSVLVPEDAERDLVHRVIYEELCAGRIEASSKAQYLRIIDGLIERGAQGIILGCTEIGLLVRPDDLRVPAFDTTAIHCLMAVNQSLKIST